MIERNKQPESTPHRFVRVLRARLRLWLDRRHEHNKSAMCYRCGRPHGFGADPDIRLCIECLERYPELYSKLEQQNEDNVAFRGP